MDAPHPSGHNAAHNRTQTRLQMDPREANPVVEREVKQIGGETKQNSMAKKQNGTCNAVYLGSDDFGRAPTW